MNNRPLTEKNIQEDKFLNALADAFRLHEAIINTTELAIVSTNSAGIINSFNSAAERLLGHSQQEVIDIATLLSFHDVEQVLTRMEEVSIIDNTCIDPAFDFFTQTARTKKGPDRTEWTLIRKNGERFPALVSLSALRDDEEELIGYVMIITDQSEQKKNHERAEVNEQKFRLLAENIPGVIYLCHNDPDYSMIYINEKVAEITGYTSEEFLTGKIHFSSLFHPDDSAKVYEKIGIAVQHGSRFHLQYRIRHRSGHWRWVEEVGVGVYADGKLLMLEGFISDITTQKLAEDKIQKIARENLRVFNNPVNLNAIVGFDGYFKRLSPSWQRILGWDDDELMDKQYIEFVHPDDVERTQFAISEIVKGYSLQGFENRYRCKDGSYRWFLWGSSSDVDYKMIYASAVDITERKQSEEQLIHSKKSLESIAGKLQEQNKQLDEFAHIISHNLRSPVGNINALIGLLDDSSSITDYKLIFEKLKKVSKNLNETMNDLMDTLKVRSNTNIERTEIRFKEVLDRVVQSLEGDLIMAEASVTFDFNQASTIVYAKAYLESIFQNLLSNAIKYRSPNRLPRIHFESSYRNGIVELSVCDNGLGIDLNQFGDKIFGLHKTFHYHTEARGVGLFLIKSQIEAMGGSIRVESKVDEGTTFIIAFNSIP